MFGLFCIMGGAIVEDVLSMPQVVDVVNVQGELAAVGIVGPVPVLDLARWYDERQGCNLAHRYEAGEVQGTPNEYGGCYFYAGGGCKMNGNAQRDACLFHLGEDAQPWQRLRRNALLRMPDGSTAITTRRDAFTIAADLGAVVVGAVRVSEVG